MSKTYGTVRYLAKRDQWEIEASPHVAMRIKRVFGGIDTRKYKNLHISATPANSRDLEWFLERWPMVVMEPEVLIAKAGDHKEREATFDLLMKGMGVFETTALKIPARDYQALAAQAWVTSQGLLLADEVGLGKTATSIAGFNRPALLPAMVVTLTHLPPQWQREIERFTDLSVHILKKGTPYDITKFHDGKFPDVVISNYHKLHGWAEVFAAGGLIRSITFDEAQELRRRESNKYAAAGAIAGAVDYRLGLTATPVMNYGGEIFNVIDVLSPGTLGTQEEFNREWCVPLNNGKYKAQDPEALGTYLFDSGLMIRRSRKDVKRELPEVTIVPHHIQCDPSLLMKMQGEAIELAKLILSESPETFKGQKMQAAGEFDNKMRQVTGISKAPFVAEFVKLLHEESGEKIVLFGWHRSVYDIWMEKLKELKPVLYTGSESATQKEASRKAFTEGDSQVLIISLRSGAGLDGLQNVCSLGVFGELDWSPGVMHQCLGRIHRDGQNNPVVAYYLLANGGSDPIMSDVLGLKKQQLDGIITPGEEVSVTKEVDPDHIRKLAERFLADHSAS